MASPRIEAPVSWPIDKPPILTIIKEPGQFFAVELASRAELFNAAHHGSERNDQCFYASWAHEPLREEASFSPPLEIWRQLAQTGQVYCRVFTSQQQQLWEDTRVSTPDTLAQQAPRITTFPLYFAPQDSLAEMRWLPILEKLQSFPLVKTFLLKGQLEMLLCRHSLSPRRPAVAKVMEWIVIITQTVQTGIVSSLILRLDFETLEVQHQEQVRQVTLAKDAALVLRASLEQDVQLQPLHDLARAERFIRQGAFWIWQDLAPPPQQLGGTIVIHALTGQLLFLATTDWSTGQILWPDAAVN